MSRRCDACAHWSFEFGDDFNTDWGECRRYAPAPVQRFQIQMASLLGSIAWIAESKAAAEHSCPEYSFEGVGEFLVFEWPHTKAEAWCGEFKRKGETP